MSRINHNPYPLARKAKGEIMLVTKVKPCVSNAINALAQLYKAGFITEVRFDSYVLRDKKHDGASYTEVIFRDFPKSSASDDPHGVAIIAKDSYAVYAFTYEVYGPFGQSIGMFIPGGVRRTWFKFMVEPVEHWAYQENAPDFWAEEDKEEPHK
jgi:hypothetical protein